MLKGLKPLLYNPYIFSSVNWFFFGTILETGRRLWQFLVNKFTAGFVLTAVFDTGDPAYDWLAAYLSKQGIWNSTREFKVTARSSTRTWGINSGGATEDGEDAHAEYTPFVDQTQIFRFNGTWCRVKRSRGPMGSNDGHDEGSQLVLTLYTRNREVLDTFMETAWSQYKHKLQTNLTIHSTCSCGRWCGTSKKGRRPIDSLILPKGLKKMLLTDTKTFIRSQAWYKEAGIQHKRGYLLYGAPGTGKTSTIHALASELDLDIYNLSLATTGVDDNGLARLISSTPANSMILIEDIDCAFPAREKKKDLEILSEDLWGAPAEKKSKITLSGLLNVLDGVSSEEGRLLFATTNYVDCLDAALLRPGRMDVKIHYKLSTRFQIINLFKQFFTITAPLPASAAKASEVAEGSETKPEGEQFADSVPTNKYSMAELQGYLLTVRTKPFEAVANVGQWMIEMADEKVRIQKEEEEEKEERKKEWMKKKKEEEEKKKREKSKSSRGSTAEQENSDDEGKSKETDEGVKEEERSAPTPTPTTEEKAAESPAKKLTPPPVVDVVLEEAPPAFDKGAEEVGSSEGVTTKAEGST
ncbi:hypothetical protein M407DRAFT_81316 [Tulasnella calospora MUT 4182]|uniref:AAA+ ATPase domain-containing protein n=1 Tax=Tulasnella calospora MUT 4182 TaxID=1051891 RepID=A0A0C3PZ13_9AGAM|nr:hypothetical protein M407DRAFT_81316 [Tulasnella calospora MUT 4182]